MITNLSYPCFYSIQIFNIDHLKGATLSLPKLPRKNNCHGFKGEQSDKTIFWPRSYILKQHFTFFTQPVPSLISCYTTFAHLRFFFTQPFCLQCQPRITRAHHTSGTFRVLSTQERDAKRELGPRQSVIKKSNIQIPTGTTTLLIVFCSASEISVE